MQANPGRKYLFPIPPMRGCVSMAEPDINGMQNVSGKITSFTWILPWFIGLAGVMLDCTV